MAKIALNDMIAPLRRDGFKVLDLVARGGGRLFGDISKVSDLPIATRDSQESAAAGWAAPSRTRFSASSRAPGRSAFFRARGNAAGSSARATRLQGGRGSTPTQRLAFIGVLACDLAALAVQDRIFLHDRFLDTHYAAGRKNAFSIGVNCARSASTCFCASMKTVPETKAGFDLSIAEMDRSLVVRSSSRVGDAIVAKLNLGPVREEEAEAADLRVRECASSMQWWLDILQMGLMLLA